MFKEDSYPKDGFGSEILAWFSQEVHKPKISHSERENHENPLPETITPKSAEQRIVGRRLFPLWDGFLAGGSC